MTAYGTKYYYQDLGMLGRHYQVQAINSQTSKHIGPKRQFTICNTMGKHNLAATHALLDTALKCRSRDQFQDIDVDADLLYTQDVNCMQLTIRKYFSGAGLSEKFFESSLNESCFEIQGPMGKGLEIDDQSSGLHVAFSAGTGILVFIDLIQRILLSNLNIFYSSRERLHPEFKLVLYQSFHSKEQACCLDLLEKILQFNDKFGFDNF